MNNPVQLLAVIRYTPEVTSLRFIRPDGFRAYPGQFCEISLEDEPSYPFTISSGTDDSYLEITAKANGDFTESWPHLEPGTRGPPLRALRTGTVHGGASRVFTRASRRPSFV